MGFPDGIKKLCSEPSMPLSRRRVEDEKGGYLSIGRVQIVRYKPNAEAIFREKKALHPKRLSRDSRNEKTWAWEKCDWGVKGQLKRI